MARNYVQRYRPFERLCHWVVAITFSILVFSGLGLFDRSFVNFLGLMGGGAQAILVHKIAGIVFAFSSVSLSLLHAKDSFHFDRDDLAWLKVAGGYLQRSGKSPPMGKYNTGQKLFDLCSLFSTLGLAGTGWVIWNPLSFPRWLVHISLAGPFPSLRRHGLGDRGPRLPGHRGQPRHAAGYALGRGHRGLGQEARAEVVGKGAG